MSVVRYAVFHPVRVLVVFVIGGLLGLAGFYAYQIVDTFESVATEEFDPGSAREAIEAQEEEKFVFVPVEGNLELGIGLSELEIRGNPGNLGFDPRTLYPTAFGDPIDDSVFDAYLLVGADASGSRADAIILALEPTGGGSPIVVSLPRDLWTWNMCRRTFTRLNEGLNGCQGSASGAELMAIMVEDYTGIPVDHLAWVNFDGFSRVVDSLGGVTICVDTPVRDVNAHLLLEKSGCHHADGRTALAWSRSRSPDRLVNGEWRRMSGSDFIRQQNQQDLLFQLAGKAAKFSSPAALSQTLNAVAASVRLDSNWTFSQAVSTGWKHRGIKAASVKRFTVDARPWTTPRGAMVMIPNVTFTNQLSSVFSLPSS